MLHTVSHWETITEGAGHKGNLPHFAVCVMVTGESATTALTSGSFGRCVHTGGLVVPGNNSAPHWAAVRWARLVYAIRTRGPTALRCVTATLCGSASVGLALHCYAVVWYTLLSCLGLEWHGTGLPWHGGTLILGRRYISASVDLARQELTACSDWHLRGTGTDGQGTFGSIAPGLSCTGTACLGSSLR